MDREAPFVHVVVVNWNGWQHTVGCLQSLRRLDYPNFRVVVVDNGSTDGSTEHIRAAHPDIELVEAGKNLGFGGGANIGIRAALDRGADYVWVLNNDIEVEPATLSSLVSVARSRPGIGIVGAAVWQPATECSEAIMAPEAFVWREEYRAYSACPEPALACPEPALACPEPAHPVDDVAGSSALMDGAMLRQIGSFEDRFFHYWDDVEICARARSAGWSVEHACGARIWHLVGATVPTMGAQAQYYYTRNWLLYSRWAGRGGLPTIFRRAPRMTLGRIFARRWLLQGRWNVVVASMLGAFDALRGRYGQRDLPKWLC